MRALKNLACSIDCGSGIAMFICQTGQYDFIYSPLDTPATASGGVIFSCPTPASVSIREIRG